MKSNNGFMNKNIKVSFINKCFLLLIESIALLIMALFSAFIINYWSDIPLIIKIIFPILMLTLFIGILAILFNGLCISSQGYVIFIPDYRIIRIHHDDLERVIICFYKCKNRYEIIVKLIYKNGKTLIKDYFKQYRNVRNNKLLMFGYTITQKKVDNIIKKLSNIDFVNISIYNIDNHK